MELLSYEEFMNMPGTEWIVEGLVPVGEEVMILSPEGTGKSQLALELGYCIATGESFLDYEVVQPRPVIFVIAEGQADQKTRLESYPEPPAGTLWFVVDSFMWSNSTQVKELLLLASELRVSPVVIFDTAQKCGFLEDPNLVMKGLLALGQAGVTQIILHHPRKMPAGEASSRGKQWDDAAWGPSPMTNGNRVRLAMVKEGTRRWLTVTKNNCQKGVSEGTKIEVALVEGRCVRSTLVPAKRITVNLT